MVSNMENLNPQVTRYICRELQSLSTSPLEGITVLMNEKDLTQVEAVLDGPSDTPYAGGRFRVKLNVRLQWYDKRLTYQNLREDYSLNMLDSEEFESIWFPKVNLEIFALLCHFSL